MVERTDGERHPSDAVVGCLEGKRCTAFGAETALDMVRRLEALRLAAGPFEPGGAHGDQGRIEAAEGFLAHAAVADRGVAERALDAETHGAALAAAGIDRLVVEAHEALPSGSGA